MAITNQGHNDRIPDETEGIAEPPRLCKTCKTFFRSRECGDFCVYCFQLNQWIYQIHNDIENGLFDPAYIKTESMLKLMEAIAVIRQVNEEANRRAF